MSRAPEIRKSPWKKTAMAVRAASTVAPFTGWESCEHYLGMSRDKIPSVDGYVGEQLPFTKSGDPDWANYRVGLSVDGYFPSTYARFILRMKSKPQHAFWVNMTQFKAYLEFRKNHLPDYLVYTRYRRERLGGDWNLNWFQLDEQQRFILKMDEPSFREHFVADPRGSVMYSKVHDGGCLHPPILVAEPPGYPGKARGCDVCPTSHPPLSL